jgi:hypothetical protein
LRALLALRRDGSSAGRFGPLPSAVDLVLSVPRTAAIASRLVRAEAQVGARKY